jgi:hypothetical protein
MGTPAYIEGGTIAFDAPESAVEAFEIINEWVMKANAGTLPEDQNGDYGIDNLELNAGKPFITFGGSSSRYKNMQWQMENLLNVCKPLKGIEYFDAPIIVPTDDGVYWSPEDEED